MIDTHCHLTDPRLGEELDAVLLRAIEAGVDRCITIGTGLDDDRAAIALAQSRSNVWAAVGVHPLYADENPADPTRELRELASADRVVALGEMGLDYFHDRVPVDRQRESFINQLVLATELGLPVVIHSREAIDDTLAVLADFPAVSCHFHCFTGTLPEARRILDAGHMLGLTGPVTFKKNDELRAVARLVPDNRLLLETDAPYLSPEPVRKQKTCEPAFTAHIAATIARERGVTVEALDATTTANAERFYGIASTAESA